MAAVIRHFCSQVLTAYNNQDAYLFNDLFGLEDESPNVITLRDALSAVSADDCVNLVNNAVDDTSSALSEFVNAYLELLIQSHDRPVVEFYDAFEAYFNALIPLFNGADSYFMVSFVENMSSALVDFALIVDREQHLKGKTKKSNNASRLLQKIFNIMLADRTPMDTSKRQGIFHVTNLAFKIYTKMDTMRLCQTFISNIKTGDLDLSNFPLSQQVTYRYYLGRFHFYKGQLSLAEKNLAFAFNKCHAQQYKNKRRILELLLPTRIITGTFPQKTLLQKYGLEYPYQPLIEKIKLGDIKGYLDLLDHNFDYLSKNFSYMTLRGRGVVLCWRNLMRRIHLIVNGPHDPQRALTYGHCLAGLRCASKDYSLDKYDVECILVSLVSQHYVRGYLSNQHQRLVLSKVNPFPPVCHVTPTRERYNEEAIDDYLANNQPAIPDEVMNVIEQDEQEVADAAMEDEENIYYEESTMMA